MYSCFKNTEICIVDRENELIHFHLDFIDYLKDIVCCDYKKLKALYYDKVTSFRPSTGFTTNRSFVL